MTSENRVQISVVQPAQTTSATAKTRMNLALHHLFAACKAAARLQKVEAANLGQPFGPFWDDLLHEALSVSLLTVASLESYANEFYFEDAALHGTVNPVAASLISAMAESESILSKYDLAMTLRRGVRLDKGMSYVQDVDALIKLRNAVVHFQPEWHGAEAKHESLSKKLKHRFDQSPFLPNAQLFPAAWACSSFAEWALTSTKVFLDRFCLDSGISNPLTQFKDRLTDTSDGIL